ncbi:MAG TPA: MupA/Atu3671 family FMN-dependent luciferase-like monooxygenase, partial [Pyrinomonadaceae bacterium]
MTSAAIATITSHIQIRAGSVVLPLHDPVRVAEEWAMVDNLSKGRVAVSFASGWHANDFALAPDVYHNRHEVMYEHIETVRRLWRGESVVRRDGAGTEIEIRIHPRPVQTQLPVWITAAGNPETFQTAGRMGANLLTHLLGQTVEEVGKKIELYRASWREHGHGPGAGHVTLMLHTFIGGDLREVREKVRAPFSNYLRSAIGLLRHSARSLGHDLDAKDLSEEAMDAVVAHAFERYFGSSALLGTLDVCSHMIDRLKAVGVDEVACLIDFGVGHADVLSGLRYLNELRERSNPKTKERREDASVAAQIVRHHVTHLQCTPSAARTLASEPESLAALRTLKGLLVGGEALPAALARQLREALPCKLYNTYGAAEATVRSTTYQIEDVGSSVPIGEPIANTQVRLLDARMRPVPPGVPGELYIGGAGVARGYLHRPGLTAERFVPDPLGGEPGARLYRTGDSARYLPDGNIEFLGRVDNQVKIRGRRVEVGEVEATLRRHPGVGEVAVVAREDETGEKRLFAYVVPGENASGNLSVELPRAEVERVLAGRPHFKLPNGMVVAHPTGYRASVLYREIFEGEIYLRHGITLNDGDCVFDVGANVGMFTLFANHKRKNLTVYAFEPIPPLFEVLSTNVALYGLNAKLFNSGVSNVNDSAVFTFYPQMPGLSGRYADRDEDERVTQSIISEYLRTSGSEQEKALLGSDELAQLMKEQ